MNKIFSYDFISREDLDDLAFYIYALCAIESGMSRTIGATINFLVEECGYTINRHEGRTNDKVLASLQTLLSKELIKIDKDICAINNSNFFEIKVLDKELPVDKQPYISITDKEWKKIVLSKIANKPAFLRLYLYLKSKMFSVGKIYMVGSINKEKTKITLGMTEYMINECFKKLKSNELFFDYQMDYVVGGKTYSKNYYSNIPFNAEMVKLVKENVLQIKGRSLAKDKGKND